jgi:rubredoxin
LPMTTLPVNWTCRKCAGRAELELPMMTTDENRCYGQECARLTGETADLDHRHILVVIACAWSDLPCKAMTPTCPTSSERPK